MQLAVIGLGRMGGNIARRLLRAGHQCPVFDMDEAAVAALAGEGATPAADLASLVSALARPRAIWVMLPAGAATQGALDSLLPMLDAEDVVIEGGNSFWKDSAARAKIFAAKGVHYLDVGTSGGVWGLARGYCLMIGGDAGAVARLAPVFAALAPGEAAAPANPQRKSDTTAHQGWLHCGASGAGHYTKMVHNGIEYGMMQAMAEGLDLLKNGPLAIDVAEVTENWRRGSVVSSWLLDLTAAALAQQPDLANYSGR
ncbi:MAG: NADP-dependent phosphogluconate dehydrogenase, partial [Alphaproteobacteria bacterium]|nr:NADP-dependent phosphogluconate dehydrogenase [Alphaproteobacteria bacterium]